MRFKAAEGGEGNDEEITFLYEVAPVAHRSYGLNVARLARIPRGVIEVAKGKSMEMEGQVKRRKLAGTVNVLGELLKGEVDIEQLVASIEQL
jgi:DNA mismatch repair protein MSH3